MKKRFAFLLAILLCFTLCGCPAILPETAPEQVAVHITAGLLAPGIALKDVPVEVVIDNQPVACQLILTSITNDGSYVMAEDEPVQEGFLARLDVCYTLPEGCDLGSIEVTADCDGGEYDGTVITGKDDTGCVEVQSHFLYGKAKNNTMIHSVHIRMGAMYPGMTVGDVDAAVTIDDEPVQARIILTEHSDDGVREMAATEIIPENALIRVNVYYYLDQGLTLDNIDVYMDFPDGEYDGTGSVGNHADGRVEAWSHGFYGLSTPPENTEIVKYPQTHVHDWSELNPGPITCTTDTVITYACTCGETKQETIPAPGHDMHDSGTTQPTCTDYGTRTIRCSRCSYVIVVEIPVTGHQWSAWVNATGRVHKHTCSVCGAEEEAPHNIPAGDVICTDCGAAIIN